MAASTYCKFFENSHLINAEYPFENFLHTKSNTILDNCNCSWPTQESVVDLAVVM